jgi:hypothetical protein
VRPGGLVILLMVTGIGVSRSLAGAGDFVPTPRENGATLDLFASHEREDITSVARPYDWSDTFLREKITLFSDGYVYHPRFLQYHLAVGGALKEERYVASTLPSAGWKNASGLEYDVKLFFLAEHPYNAELFALRYEPLFKEQAATQHTSVETSRGVSFQYRKKPALFRARYSFDTIDAGTSSTDTSRLGLDGRYVRQFRDGRELSFDAAFNPSWATTSRGLEADTRQSLFGVLFDAGSARLNSSLARTTYDQDDPASGHLSNDQFSWYEVLSLALPHQDNESTFPDPSVPGERTLSDTNRDLQLDIIHRLYESLDSTYTYLNTSRTSAGGDTRTTSNTLNLNYSKAIPRGRVGAGTIFGRSRTESEGATDIVDEPHPSVMLSTPFTLAQPNADPATIVVFLKSPIAPFDNIQLVEGSHYSVTAVGNTFEILVTAVPAPFLPPGPFDFFVSYSLVGGDFDLVSRTLGVSTSVDLLDMLLTPYSSYVEVRSDLISGVFPGVPLDSTTWTAGLRFLKGPLRARGEYQDLRWDVSPYRAWRGEFQYVGTPRSNTSVYGTLAYVDKYFPQGTSTDQRGAYSEQTMSASGNIRKEIPSRRLSLSAGGSLSRAQSRVDTNAWSLSSSLSWKIGLLDLTAAASVYGSSTRGIPNAESDRTHQYYTLMLRRQIFAGRRGPG